MAKIGRNEPCPCGSGKKYKKCCLGKADVAWTLSQPPPTRKPASESLPEYPMGRAVHWDMNEVHALSNREIIRKLREFGVDYRQDRFLEEYNSTSEVAAHWQEIYPITAKGFDIDFLWMGARVLWERLAPDMITTERLDDMMQEGYTLLEANKKAEGCILWLEVWAQLKKRFTPAMKSIGDAEIVFEGMQSLHNWCEDLEMELGNAARDDPAFHHRRIAYCREFCQLFPESYELILQNMRRAEAETHFDLGQVEEGEALYKALIQDYPESAWGYIGWGDMYWLFRANEQVPLDYDKAERIYHLALEKGVEEDRDVVLERLEELTEMREGQEKEEQV